MKGYGGRVLHVDVSSGKSRAEPVSEEMARSLVGGNGFAVRLLLDHVSPGTDAYDPANAVVFAVGPITDTAVPGNSRACVASKSPLTGLFFDSTFGGRFPATMKRTGWDAIVITGRSAEPVYLRITEAGAELRPAAGLWGQSTRDTVQAIQAVEGGEVDVMAIGPAGENLVRFAAMGTYWKNREGFAGRGGIAAVLGSKRVKAVIGRRHEEDGAGRPRRSRELLDERREPLMTGTKALTTYGTPFLVKPINTLGALGAYNLRQETFADAMAISGEEMRAHHHSRDTTCLKCPVACGKQYEIKDGELAGHQGEDARVRDDLRLRLDAGQRPCRLAGTRQRPLRPPRHGHDHDGRDAGVHVRGARARLARPGRDRRTVRLGGLARHAPVGRADGGAARGSATGWPRAPSVWPSRCTPKPPGSSMP